MYILIFYFKNEYNKKENIHSVVLGGFILTVNDAVVKRVVELLEKKKMSQYRLEQLSGIQHGHMQWIMSGKSKTVTFSTVIRLANGFGMSLIEFLNNDVFIFENLDVE